jgi:hypothetical protein
VAGLEVTARCLIFVCQGEGGGAANLLQARGSLGVLLWWCGRGKGEAALVWMGGAGLELERARGSRGGRGLEA